jgi:hypothetical protein
VYEGSRVYRDSLKSRNKFLAFCGAGEWGMIRGGFLSARKHLIASARDGSAASPPLADRAQEALQCQA